MDENRFLARGIALNGNKAKAEDVYFLRVAEERVDSQYGEDLHSLFKARLEQAERPFTVNIAYIQYQSQLYLFNAAAQTCSPLTISEKEVVRLHLEFGFSAPFHQKSKSISHGARRLTEADLNKLLLLFGDRPGWRKAAEFLAGTEWKKKKGCELLILNADPESSDFDWDALPVYHAAYFRYKNKLWYYKRTKTGRVLQALNHEVTPFFDYMLKTTAKLRRFLSDKELELIHDLTGHLHQTSWQKFLSRFGNFCSGFIAVGSGVSIAAAFISLNVLSGGLAIFGALLLFIAGTGVNWWMYKKYVSPVLIDLFGREKFLMDEDGEPLSPLKKSLLIGSLVLSLSVGATFAALTYGSTFTLTAAFSFLTVLSPLIVPLAAVLGGITFICLAALTIKDITQLIKTKNALHKSKEFLKNLFSFHPDLPHNRGKKRWRIKAERITTAILVALFIPFAAVGLFMTMNACVPGVKSFLLDRIPSASVFLVDIVSKVITLGLAFVGQMPFGVKVILNGVARIFGPKEHKEETPVNVPPVSTGTKTWNFIKRVKVIINAIGYGLIAMMGAIGSFIVGIGAFISASIGAYWTGSSAIAPKTSLITGLKLPKRTCHSFDDDCLLLLKQREKVARRFTDLTVSQEGLSFSESRSLPGELSPQKIFPSELAEAKTPATATAVVKQAAKSPSAGSMTDDIALHYKSSYPSLVCKVGLYSGTNGTRHANGHAVSDWYRGVRPSAHTEQHKSLRTHTPTC